MIQILIHSPHRRTTSNMGRTVSKENSKELILLSINQSVTAICAGRLNPSKESDILVVGTPTNLLAYDVENNMDIFYKEVTKELYKIINKLWVFAIFYKLYG